MAKLEIAPYHHPTQVVLVDDDIDFLGNLSLQLDVNLAYLLFDSTQKALGYLNQRQCSAIVRDHFFREHARAEGSASGCDSSKLLEIDTSALYREMHSSNRFSQISVVLVDYAMPQMNGLEFCQSINDPHIKKILFTGVATESLAVNAFNNGIIDQYIRKHEHSVYDRLNRTICQFQRDYIRDLFINAADALPLAMPDMLGDVGVAMLIDELRSNHGLVEYYMTDNPSGFYFATADGRLRRVVIQTPEELRQAAASLDRARMPAEWMRRVAAGGLIVHPDIAEWPDDADRSRLEALVAPAAFMPDGHGNQRWAMFDVLTDGRATQVKPSYNEFLEWLDAVGYSLM